MPKKKQAERKIIVKCRKCKKEIELEKLDAFYLSDTMSMVGKRAFGIPKNSEVAVPFDEFFIDYDKSNIIGICSKCKKEGK